MTREPAGPPSSPPQNERRSDDKVSPSPDKGRDSASAESRSPSGGAGRGAVSPSAESRSPSAGAGRGAVSPSAESRSPSGGAGRGEVRIRIRGTRKGLSVTLGKGDWQQLLRELDERLGQAAAFFQGSQVNLRTGKRHIGQRELEEVMGVLVRHNIELASLETGSRLAGEAAQALGVRLALPEATHAHPEIPPPTEEWSEGLLLRRTVRSGQSIRHPGHVVVIGDVNPGAEIIAGGDVVVWGKLRGMVQAGALGNNEAIVCALEMRPTLLRIGSYIATSPDDQGSTGLQPEVASVLDGQIVARPWSSK